MRKLFTLLTSIFVLSMAAQCQQGTFGLLDVYTRFLPPRYADTTNANPGAAKAGSLIYVTTGANKGLWTRNLANTAWESSGGSVNLDTLQYYVKIVSQNPTATLTGGTNLELMGAGADLPYTLSWSAGRFAAGTNLLATANLSTITVAGTEQVFVNPPAGSTVSGAQAINVVRNSNTTYSNVVVTEDSKTATATTSFTFLPKRYYGWVSDTTGIGTPGYNDAIITALSNELSASKSKTWSTGSPSGTQFYVFAYWSASGALTQFDFNGFPSIDAMNTATRSFTNALGYTGTWIIYWNKNGQTTSSSIITN